MDEKRITLRLPEDLHARLAVHAKRERRSLNSEILILLEIGLGNAGANAEPPRGETA
ncbi:toxin-antitoxin system HicB family antitoxin [Streptomyces sp. NPDC059970]|uniref:toxin-antitoxin system HicB family antitoxin n=1 Tax=Streptomyces sp. NPDC059970 TaxID=3347019 RepID=UPI00368C6AFF